MRLVPRFYSSIRSISTSPVVRCDHNTRGVVGSNLPFSLANPTALLLKFSIFCMSGVAAPYLVLRFMVLKKNAA